MRNKIYIFVGITTIGFLIFSSLVFGQTEGEVYQVDILHDEQGWHIEPCPLPGYSGDTWRIRNFASDTICVKILIIVDKKNPPFYIYTLAPTDSTDHPIGQWDCGIVAFLGPCPPSGYPLTMCERPCGPALTQWGIIVLVMLLIASTAFILRRKKQTI
ncbi:MAG: hypothetical protein KAX39_06275 [candidate division Zixibacteria bacterium]|nr:hypothetical protein [candidate division Zixibacteria bacterium]